MGQQQLLLVILVTIIVGIATVVALNVFGTQAEQANEDAVRQDMMSGAATAQGYYMRPTNMGGGGGDFTDIDLDDLNIPGVTEDEDDDADNENATGWDVNGDGDKLTITATGVQTGEEHVGELDRDQSGEWEFTFDGEE